MSDYNAVKIYTDGSCLKNPGGAGGIGFRIILPEDENGENEIHDFSPTGYKATTNNRMELRACLSAIDKVLELKLHKKHNRFIVFTDSKYLHENRMNALKYWANNDWVNQYGEPYENIDLWKEFKSRHPKLSFETVWVKGHSKNEHNNVADNLANKSARKPFNEDYGFNSGKVRRSKNKVKKKTKTVEMLGQRMTIYVRNKKATTSGECGYKLDYEVLTKTSKYFNYADSIYTSLQLKAGHTYYVLVNNDPKYPQVIKVFREITKP